MAFLGDFGKFFGLGSSEEVLGELFSIFILETIIIGNLLNLNPYNQPAVEQVKISTKKLRSIFDYSKHLKNVNFIFRRVFK